MTTYKVQAGDTFELIARRVYGAESEAARIVRANPGAADPPQAGTTLAIPVSPEAPAGRRVEAPAATPDEVAIRIDGKRFRFWESVRIIRSLDSLDTIEIAAPFDVDLPGFKETFRPFSYKEIDVTIGGDLLFTGTLVGVNPQIALDGKTVTATGYSLPGVLNDCTAPASAYPLLEFNDQGLREIAETVAGIFGIRVEFAADPGAPFTAPPGAIFSQGVTLAPGRKVLAFLAGLAKQRNMVIGNTEAGALLFRRSLGDGAPAANFRQGEFPLSTVAPQFRPQEYFSHVTGVPPVFFGIGGTPITEKNPHLEGVLRSHTFSTQDTDSAPVVDVVKAKIGRMFGNAVSYNIGVATIRDPSGNLWAPDTVVTLEAPDAMVYKEYAFTVRAVEITQTRDKVQAGLNLVLPGSFGGQIPEALPWD